VSNGPGKLARELLERVFVVRSRFLIALAAGMGLWLSAPAAHAEGWITEGTFAVGSGLEGGDPGPGSIVWRRARTRIVAGFDLRSDENEQDSWGLRAFAEIEKRGGAGLEARYTRWMSRSFGGFVFATATLVPKTVVGAGFGACLGIPFGKRASFAIEPAFAALPFGSDVPGQTVLLLGSLSLGLKVNL